MNLREKQRRGRKAKEDELFFMKFVVYEIVAFFLIAVIGWLLRKEPFPEAFKTGVCIISLTSLIVLGSHVFSELAYSGWHLRRADESYPVFVAIRLMVINAVLYPLADERERSYFMLLAPVLPWLILIVVATIRKWKLRL
jgi:hypothetical protein